VGLLGEYVEVESGKDDARPKLAEALKRCKLTGATLIVAKLDRLSRNQSFLMNVYEGTGEAGVVFCDLPKLPPGPVGKFMVQQMAAVAELERGLNSQRTKAALAAAKARGVVLGGYKGGPVPDAQEGGEARKKAADAFAHQVGSMILDLSDQRLSLRQIAAQMASRGVRTANGGEWTAAAVSNVLKRLAKAA
jgi:DNA invertase Pin-like site-specific DNA recombinase